MDGMATITSKRQFTIPVGIFKRMNYKPQQKLLVQIADEDRGIVTIQPMSALVEELAGSVSIADEYKGLDIDEMIEKAKFDYFSKKQ